MARREARAWAMRLMYARDMGAEALEAVPGDWMQEDAPESLPAGWQVTDQTYITEILEGTLQHDKELDERLSLYTKHWRIDRLAKVDLAILRLAAFELLYRDDVPTEVAINEAVELAKQYGGQDSSAFVNGVLSSFAKGMADIDA